MDIKLFIMPIASPINSFVDFNSEPVTCNGDQTDVALPVYDNFSIKFQFFVDNELLAPSTIFKAAVCSETCDLIFNPNYTAMPLCGRYIFGQPGQPLLDEYFPITVGNYAPEPGQPQIPEGTYSKIDFIQAIKDYYDYSLPGFDFFSCCEVPVISGIVVFYNGTGPAIEIGIHNYYGYGYVDFPPEALGDHVGVNECFRYCILNEANVVLACSNLFYRIADDCYTTVFNYYNEENGYGFKYVVYDDNGVSKITENQIRLSVMFDQPRHLVEEEILRRSDKVQQRLTTLIEKEWRATTSYLSEQQHDKLTVLLKHDVLSVYNRQRQIYRRMVQIGAPEPDFPEVRNFPTYPASFTMRDYALSYVNNNCGFNCGIELVDTCEPGGGVVPPCPEPFKDEIVMEEGQTEYQNNELQGLNENQIEVYREGLLQYTTGGNRYALNSTTGVISLIPAAYQGERLAIIEI